ncbi:cholinesterase 1-like isoform X2 [Thrips palmi]|uniref:Carboxylic ester hydrolase n=1 Tax=Thrips palmi TaxID=161013 RepID=A0A6P8Y8B8_THRPL|nr:cholinesterase 1-like isoform X2 [Thrips palmi]XP_034235878.1 cholinesterase 1-like isoform X2 [Thrips palmi]
MASKKGPKSSRQQRKDSKRPVIKVRDGFLRGKTHSTELGTTYSAFRGIPYAKPPVGKLRFKAPEPAQPWTGVRDASREGNICTQPFVNFKFQPASWALKDIKAFMATIPTLVRRVGKILRQSEDCLFLNVYTPALPHGEESESLLPVMFFIHGGACLVGDGDSDIFGPDYFLDKGIVVVTFNYRLGPFGFLGVGTEAAPGNAGLKDQVLALRWVRDNVAAFGGDPNRVTIFGESAGGVSVHLHTLSPQSRGLFHAAIASSGSALHGWAMQADPLAKARELGHHLGIEESDPDDLAAALSTISAGRLLKAIYKLKHPARFLCHELMILPVVEPPSPDAFLSEDPREILKRGDQASVPIMFSVNNREGLLWLVANPTAGRFAPETEREMALLERRRANLCFLPEALYDGLDPEQRVQCHDEIMQHYFDGKTLKLDMLPQFLNAFADVAFLNPLYEVTKLHAINEKAPVYVCHLNYDGGLHFFRRLLQHKHPGMGHGDELGYLFRIHLLPETTLSSADMLYRQRMLNLWVCFIKSTNHLPTEAALGFSWSRAWQNGRMDYLEVGDELSMRQEPPTSGLAFWDDLYRRYLGRPILP